MREAKAQRRVPILVAYNAPFRDCAQYSAGGATDTAAYKAWIDGFAAGIGGDPAVVILEPDSLGIIPYNTTIYGAADWCKPTVTDASGNPVAAPGASPDERYAQLNYAVDAIEAKAPRAMVYLDGTHSGWLGVGEAAYRLVKAGVQRAQGFFLNVSNYQPNDQLAQFGTWVSDCITAATAGADWAAGHFDWCPSQYDPALGYAVNYAPEYAATVTAGLANMMGGAAATTHFVLDTGRNGQGPWHPTAVVSGRAGLVQPARPRRRLASDGQRGRAARSTRSSGSRSRANRTARAIGASRARRPIPSGAASWIRPPAGGSPRRRWSSPVWPHRRCSSRRNNRRAGRAVDAGRRKWLASPGALPERPPILDTGSFSGAAGIQGPREFSMRSTVLLRLCIAAACTSLGACAGVKPLSATGSGGTGGNDASVGPPNQDGSPRSTS